MANDFYRVNASIDGAPLRDCLLHGYDTRGNYESSMWQLVRKWRGRIGEAVEVRHYEHSLEDTDLIRLRFHDTPGGRPDEAWLPRFLLTKTDMPDYLRAAEESSDYDSMEEELDRAYGFD